MEHIDEIDYYYLERYFEIVDKTRRRKRYGLADCQGKIVLPPMYISLGWEDNNILTALIRSGDIFFYYTDQSSWRPAFAFWMGLFFKWIFKYTRVLTLSNAILFLDGQYVISHDWETNAQSLFSLDGEKVFQKDYDEIYPTSNQNCIFVRQGKRWLVLDREEQVVREIFFHY